jgi:hypothetical protein
MAHGLLSSRSPRRCGNRQEAIMKGIALVAAAAASFALPVLAADGDAESEAVKAANAALADRAEPFAMPPTLPDAASDRAKDAALGQQGARKKADAAKKAQDEAGMQEKDSANDANLDAANRAAHGAASSAAGAANADSHAAAGQARAAAVRDGSPTTPPGKGH